MFTPNSIQELVDTAKAIVFEYELSESESDAPVTRISDGLLEQLKTRLEVFRDIKL